MLIIFEGNEGSGKSTLAKMFAERYNTKVMKRTSHKNWTPGSDGFQYEWDLNESALWDWRFFLEMIGPLCKNNNFICDRSFITQEVYHRAFWKGEDISIKNEAAYQGLPKVLSTIPHIVFHLKRTSVRLDDDVVNNYAEGSHIENSEAFNIIDESYDSFYTRKKRFLNLHIIDNNCTIEETFDKLISKYFYTSNSPINEKSFINS